MASASSRRPNRKYDFYPPRTWVWVLAFWILLLLACFTFAQPPSIVEYHRQNLYNYLCELYRNFVSTAILLWRLCPWDSIYHLWDFPPRSWELAMMQLHSVDWSLVISRLKCAWNVLKVVAGLSIGQWPILPAFAPDIVGKVFWGSFKPKKLTARAWLIEKMVILLIVVLWTTCGGFLLENMGFLLKKSWLVMSTLWTTRGDFCLKDIGSLLKESWFVMSTCWSTGGDISRAHIWAWLKKKWLMMLTYWSSDGDFSFKCTWGALKERSNNAWIWSLLDGGICSR